MNDMREKAVKSLLKLVEETVSKEAPTQRELAEASMLLEAATRLMYNSSIVFCGGNDGSPDKYDAGD